MMICIKSHVKAILLGGLFCATNLAAATQAPVVLSKTCNYTKIGPKTYSCDYSGNSHLTAISVWDKASITSALGTGEEINLADARFGLSPLHHAAVNGWQDVVDALLVAGANIKATGQKCGYCFGWTPLHVAVYFSHPKIVSTLINEYVGQGVGLDICIVSQDRYNGYSALHFAALNNFLKIVEMLLVAGANPTLLADNDDKQVRADALTTDLEIQRMIQAACENWPAK
jgi:ankyrin repeat protein